MSESLRNARFDDRDLQDARFASCDLTGVVVRGSRAGGSDVLPW